MPSGTRVDLRCLWSLIARGHGVHNFARLAVNSNMNNNVTKGIDQLEVCVAMPGKHLIRTIAFNFWRLTRHHLALDLDTCVGDQWAAHHPAVVR